MVLEGKLYKNKELGNVVRVLVACDIYVEAEDINTLEIFEMSMSQFDRNFEEL